MAEMTPDEKFIKIMFDTWTADEMAYMPRRVMHPSYGMATPKPKEGVNDGEN